MLGVEDLNTIFKEAIIPHIITQEIISLGTNNRATPNFWVREKSQSTAEVDLVYSYNGMVFPIETKSGKSGALRSLHQFINRSSHPYAIRIYGGKYKVESAITPEGTPYFLLNLPYYLGTKIPQYIKYFIENYG